MHSGHHSTHAHREEEGIFYLCLPPCGCHHLLFSYHIYVCPAPSHTYLQHEQSNFYLLCHCHTSSQPFHLLPKEPRGQRGSEETGLLPVHPLWLVCYNWLERSDLILCLLFCPPSFLLQGLSWILLVLMWHHHVHINHSSFLCPEVCIYACVWVLRSYPLNWEFSLFMIQMGFPRLWVNSWVKWEKGMAEFY